jgi:hypothetical protein
MQMQLGLHLRRAIRQRSPGHALPLGKQSLWAGPLTVIRLAEACDAVVV